MKGDYKLPTKRGLPPLGRKVEKTTEFNADKATVLRSNSLANRTVMGTEGVNNSSAGILDT